MSVPMQSPSRMMPLALLAPSALLAAAAVWLQPVAAIWATAAAMLCALALAGLLHPTGVLHALIACVVLVPPHTVLIDLGLSVTLDRLLLALLAAGLTLRLYRRGDGLLRLPLAAPLLALAVLYGLGLIGSLRPLEAVLQLLYNLVVGFFVLWGSAELLSSLESRRRAALVLWVCVVCTAALGLFETASGSYVFVAEARHYRGNWLRAASSSGNPVPHGASLAMAIPLGWYLLRSARGYGAKLLLGIGLVVALLGMAASFSRLAYLALAAAAATMATSALRINRLLLPLAALAGIAALSAALWAGPLASVFFDRYAVSNIVHRLYMSQTALYLLAEHPLLGVGLGSFRELAFATAAFGGLKPPLYGEHPTADNSYLALGAELGLPGAWAFFVLLAGALMRAVRASEDGPAEHRALGRALLGGLVAYAVGALFLEVHAFLGLSTIFFFLSGLASSPARSVPKAAP